MKAWLYNSTTGGLKKNIHLDTSRILPSPSPQEVLVQVLVASLNPAAAPTRLEVHSTDTLSARYPTVSVYLRLYQGRNKADYNEVDFNSQLALRLYKAEEDQRSS